MQQRQTSYDEIPYPSNPFRQTRPERLAAVTCPVLVVVGERERAQPQPRCRQLHSARREAVRFARAARDPVGHLAAPPLDFEPDEEGGE